MVCLAATAATTGAEGVATTVAATVAIGAEDFTGLAASTELAVTVAMADLALPSWSPRPSIPFLDHKPPQLRPAKRSFDAQP